jgi:hypothetical protein
MATPLTVGDSNGSVERKHKKKQIDMTAKERRNTARNIEYWSRDDLCTKSSRYGLTIDKGAVRKTPEVGSSKLTRARYWYRYR